MQADSTLHKTIIDTGMSPYVLCKPDTITTPEPVIDYKQLTDSLQYKFLFLYSGKYNQINTKLVEEHTLRPSIFKSHSLQYTNKKERPVMVYSSDWLVIVLLFTFILFTWSFFNFGKRVNQILKSTISNRLINQLTRDGDIFKERISVVLTLTYLLSTAVFVFYTTHFFFNLKKYGYYNYVTFAKIVLAISLVMFLKWLVTRLVGDLFKNYIASSIYILNSFAFNILIALILVPINVFIIYTPSDIGGFIIRISLLSMLIINVVRYVRYVIIGFSFSKFSQFYLFLYLCTLEIIPVLILIKVAIGMINKWL